jgi:predicted unusual protein kinase regulating ubiquinone biosynthesis (AarF/ABC1/UbiB family)
MHHEVIRLLGTVTSDVIENFRMLFNDLVDTGRIFIKVGQVLSIFAPNHFPSCDNRDSAG